MAPYLTVVEADALIAQRFINTTSWDALDDTTKEKYLLISSDRIDTLTYRGYKRDDSQDRQFPRCYETVDSSRYNVHTKDYGICDDGIPYSVQTAVCNESIYLLSGQQNDIDAILNKGVTGFSASKYSESYDLNKVGSGGIIDGKVSKSTADILVKYLTRRGIGVY